MIKYGIPFLLYDGQCEDALAYYTKVFHAQITEKMTFREVGYEEDETRLNCIANSTFKLGESLFYAADVIDKRESPGWGNNRRISVWIELETASELQELEQRMLAGGSESITPAEATSWNSLYAKLQDPFGIVWELNAQM